MGKTAAAIAGYAEWAPQRTWERPMFAMEAAAELAVEALADAGMEKDEVDALVLPPLRESPMFAPSALAEYLGVRSNFNETVDLGGASACGMVWRAAAAIEVGACDTALVLCPSVPAPRQGGGERGHMRMSAYMGGDAWGSPQGQFEIPAGLSAATPSFAMIASRYLAEHRLTPETLAKIAVHERDNALENPLAIFRDTPISIDDVLQSRMVADPLKLLEIVMPCFGGAAMVITRTERAGRGPHRPVRIAGFGEHLTHKSVTYMPDLLDTPSGAAAERAFRMAGVDRGAIDLASIYDCYTITVLLTIEDAGFCGKGEGGAFIDEHDLRFNGDWPLNTHGGQLGMGQAGLAGGLSHVVEAARQIQQRGDTRQVDSANLAYVNGTGGMMAEQVALILQGA